MAKYYFNHRALILFILISLFFSMKNTHNAAAQQQFEKLQYPFDINYKEVAEGVQIAYADEGSKNEEGILFIHGLGSYAPAWKHNIQKLSKYYRCIVVDLPGYGKSSKDKYKADMSFHSKHLFQLMNKLEIGKFHIAGHSMGGQIAISMALSQPEKIESLMLMAPAGIETFTKQEIKIFESTSSVKNLAELTDEQYKINLSLNFYQMDEKAQFMYDDRMIIKNDPQITDYYYVINQGVMGMLNEPVFDKLKEVKAPVLVVYGKQDKLIPNKYLHPEMSTEEIGKLAEENIPNVKLEMIDEAGHFVHFEQAEKVNELMINFMKSN